MLGTPKENSMDMVERKRSTIGVKNGSARLDEGAVLKILELRGQGWTYKRLASEFGVGESTIGRVVKRTHWRHIGD